MRKSSWHGTGMSEAAARFDLPARSVFEPPSYPNVWFYVHERVAASQDAAVSLVTGWLRVHCGITNDFGHWKPPEASDSQARLGGLQPWTGGADPAQHHAHDLHIRYYYVALRQTRMQQVALQGARGPMGRYQRFAGSVHYEVADEHPLHPYIDDCPYCGRTGHTRERTISLPVSTNRWVWNSCSTARSGGSRGAGPTDGRWAASRS